MGPGAPLTAQALRSAFGMFPSGVTAVSALKDSTPVGMAASSFTSVSLEPALVSVCVARSSTTWPVLRTASHLGISVLSADHVGIVRELSAKTGDRFAHVQWEADDNGAVYVRGATLWLDCSIDNEIPAGDHDIVVLRVHSVATYPDLRPMVFHNSTFHQLAV